MTVSTVNAEECRTLQFGIGRAFVERLAPEELELFDLLAATPSCPAGATDDPLAFGIDGAAIQAFTPQIMALASVAVTFVVTKLGEAGVDAVKGALQDLAKDLLKDRLKAALLSKLSGAAQEGPPTRVTELETALRAEASRLGIEKERIESLIGALLAVLRVEH